MSMRVSCRERRTKVVCVDCPLVEVQGPPQLDESFLQSASAAFLSALPQSADGPRPLDKLVSFNICKRRKEVSLGPSGWNASSEVAVGGRGNTRGRSCGCEGVTDRAGQEGRAHRAEKQDRNCAKGAQWATGRSEQSSRGKNLQITGCARRDSGRFKLGKKMHPCHRCCNFDSFFRFFPPSTLFKVSKKTFFSKWKFILSGFSKWLVSEGPGREASRLFIKGWHWKHSLRVKELANLYTYFSFSGKPWWLTYVLDGWHDKPRVTWLTLNTPIDLTKKGAGRSCCTTERKPGNKGELIRCATVPARQIVTRLLGGGTKPP